MFLPISAIFVALGLLFFALPRRPRTSSARSAPGSRSARGGRRSGGGPIVNADSADEARPVWRCGVRLCPAAGDAPSRTRHLPSGSRPTARPVARSRVDYHSFSPLGHLECNAAHVPARAVAVRCWSWCSWRAPPTARTGAGRHAGRCHPALRAGPARRGPGRRRHRDRRGAAAQRLGGAISHPSAPAPPPATFFSEGTARVDPVTGQILSGNSTQPEPQHIALRQPGSVHRLPARGRDEGRARRPDCRRSLPAWTPASSRRSTTTNQFFDALAARQLVGVREASVRRAEEQLKISITKLHAGSATRSDSLRSLRHPGQRAARPDRRPDRRSRPRRPVSPG